MPIREGAGRKGIEEYVNLLDEEILDRIAEIRAGGASEKLVAQQLNISYSTLYKYKRLEGYEELKDALNQRGKLGLIDNIQSSLYKSAMGYEFEETTKELREEGELVITKVVTKHVHPNPLSIKLALTNLDPANWKDRRVNELTGEGGGPIEIISPRDRIINKLRKYSPERTEEDKSE